MRARSLARGAGLGELLAAIFLLTFLFAGTVLIFQAGSRGFQQSVTRVGAVGEAERFSRMVKRDVTLTHFASIQNAVRSVTTSAGLVRRDGLVLAGLSDWSDPALFVGTQPLWNRRVILYSTGEERGRLMRMEVDEGASFEVTQPFANFTACLVDQPTGIPGLGRVTTITKDVHSFAVTLDASRRLVELKLLLFHQGGNRMLSQARADEYQELILTLFPKNTFPDL